MEKYGGISRFSGWLRLDFENTTRAVTVGSGSIGFV